MKNDESKPSGLALITRSATPALPSPPSHTLTTRPTPVQRVANGTAGNTAIVSAYTHSDDIDLMDVLAQLEQDAQNIHAGDSQQMEAMLINQAAALQSMFTKFALLAIRQPAIAGTQCYAQLAMRAQANCRVTLQALAEIKNPRQVAFVKQTNVAQTQQVNNGASRPRAREKGRSRQTNY